MKKHHPTLKSDKKIVAQQTVARPPRDVYATSELPLWLRDVIAAAKVPAECAKFNHEVKKS